MRYITIKICLIGLILFLCKASVLSQDKDIRCEVEGFDFNLSQHDPGYLINFGSFSLFADGEEKEGGIYVIRGIYVTKRYKLPRTKLTLSVFVVHYPKDEHEPPTDDTLMMSMILGKNRISLFLDFDNEKTTKDVVGLALTGYPMEIFDKGGEGVLSTGFFGKKKPILIIMKCKKVKKEGS